jgi:Uma2 family endonuclease
MSTAKILPYYTISDWEHWEGQWELLEGLPFAMSPAPLPKHQRIALNVAQQFNIQLKKCKACKVYQAIDWIISEDTIAEPDVLVVCKEIKYRLDFPPELVIEILSSSTALKDRNNKFRIYEQQKTKYYVIMDPHTNTVEIFMLDGNEYFFSSGLFSISRM